MDLHQRVLMMVAFWALFAASWGAFYKVWPIPLLRRTFTMRRWGNNPFQLYNLMLLLQVSVNQIVIGVPETSAQAALDHQAQVALAGCNLVGAAISAYGLHLRDFEFGLWVELSGYAALAGSLGIYITLVFLLFPMPNTSFGLALTEAFVLASIHRAVQIVRYKVARHRRTQIAAQRLRERIDNEDRLP
jgi:hypothetical protein